MSEQGEVPFRSHDAKPKRKYVMGLDWNADEKPIVVVEEMVFSNDTGRWYIFRPK